MEVLILLLKQLIYIHFHPPMVAAKMILQVSHRQVMILLHWYIYLKKVPEASNFLK